MLRSVCSFIDLSKCDINWGLRPRQYYIKAVQENYILPTIVMLYILLHCQKKKSENL